MLYLSNSALCFVWPRIPLTVQIWGAHKSKQSISKKNGLFKFNSRKVLESGVYNRAGQNKRQIGKDRRRAFQAGNNVFIITLE